ncbi:TOMM precursor leader peptide-binding protein [Micromonospora krabiensis]|uniref:Ribosomal protein S12 methylthiotransferase accessory factor n=1 Tax=Micromonospora krabiensis TaxID=307121 RepID=A0A1C3MWU6_9ACTN|nr:TOMM precursor leader peptide-binding protein [Micromonospora krabiensis]SBV24787.1 ribosomal protein S12 methylthiotransferase accessory factor [Micromonospora krabiensis]
MSGGGSTTEDLVCAGLARLLAERGCDVEVLALGVRDELSAPARPAGATRVLLYGQLALLGPLSSAAACPTCLARRWQAVRHRDLRDAVELGGETVAAGPWPYATPFVADFLHALIEAHRAAPDGPGRPGVAAQGVGTALQVDVCTLRVHRAPLLPDPDCPSCGGTVDDAPELATIDLPATPKVAPGSFRSRDLDDYPLDVEAFANPVCGALGATLWQDLTSLSTSPAIGSFTLRSGRYLRETLYGGHADGYRRSARIAVLEGLERAAGLRPRGKRTAVTATLRELGDDALDPRECGLYTDAFYQANPYLHRFDPDRPITWVWGWSLREQRAVLVPEILVYYHAASVEERFVQETSNGCASGASLVEAVYHGLMEAIERDAFLLAWYGGRSLPEIDPDSIDRPQTRMMIDRLAMYGYQARFFDTRMTFDIPVVTAVAVRADGGLGALAFGGGASLDPQAAITAALCEIATDSVMVRVRAGADEPRLRRMVTDFAQVQGLHDHPLLYGLPQMAHHAAFLLRRGPRPAPMAELYERDRPAPPVTDDLRDDLERCLKTVTAQGFDVIAVDQSTPEQRDLGLATASVVVPGLLPIDFGWLRQRAPHTRRLRTAFRTAGLLDRDLRDDEIHFVPHPFP